MGAFINRKLFAFLSHPQVNAKIPAVLELPTTCKKMKFLVGLALCCAAIFVVADARSAGAPADACNNLTPQHSGTTEQEGDNPWMIDISSFRNGSGYNYVPGYTYNSKMETPACS